MKLLYLVGTIWALLLLTFVLNFDTRRPISTKLKYKYRVKDDSIFRKIIKFKDKEHYPCNYFKIVPIYVLLLLAITSLILYFVDIFANGFITSAVSEEVIAIAAICILVISIVYYLVINIWWEIVDYNEFKFTKEEKEELKRLRKIRIDNKNNKN